MQKHSWRHVYILCCLALLSVSVVPASAAVKAGSKCNTIGQVRSGLTCVKVNKNLVWQKKKIQAAEPTGLPLTLDNLDPKRVPIAAYEATIAALKMRSRAAFSPNYFLSPTIDKSRADQEIDGLNRAIDLWSPYFTPTKFQVVYMTGRDSDWMDAKASEIGLSSMLPPGTSFGNQIKMWAVCNFAMAGKDRAGTPTFVHCLDGQYSGGNKQTGPHEYTHLFQQSFNGMRNVWYSEGSASYFGWTLGFYPYNPNSSERSSWLSRLFWNISPVSKSEFASRDLTKFKSQMKLIADVQNSQQTANIGYWVGGLATEALVAVYGFDKFVEFAKAMQDGTPISNTLQKVYGINEETFYEKLAPYVWSTMKNY